MPVTFKEVDQKRFFRLQDILDSGILGPIVAGGGSGVITYMLTNSHETALKVVGGVYLVAVWLNGRIKAAKVKKEE